MPRADAALAERAHPGSRPLPSRRREDVVELKGQASIVLPAPAEGVYEYLLNFTRHPEWTGNLARVWKVSAGPIAVGTVFRAQEWAPPVSLGRRLLASVFFVVGLAQGSRPYSEAEVTALEPGRRIAWVGRVRRRGGEFNRAEWEVLLEATSGGTRLTQRFRYFPQTAAARGMLGSLGGAAGIERGCAVNLARLKRVLEQRGASPPAPS